jgi:HSP20 family protein
MFNRSDMMHTSRDPLTNTDWAPAVDIVETPEEYLVKAELPEINKEDVHVSVEQGVLRMSGERKQEHDEKNRKYHRVERVYGSFMRSFVLPENVDESKLRADFKDGILNVHLPKAEKAKPRSVEIKVS